MTRASSVASLPALLLTIDNIACVLTDVQTAAVDVQATTFGLFDVSRQDKTRIY